MLIRQSVNLAVHFAAGAAVGMLAVIALERSLRRDRDAMEAPPVPPPAPGLGEAPQGGMATPPPAPGL